jgi:hypothetical protein
MPNSIHLGYVVGTGEPVEIPLRHTAVTGQTQESGKTTTLEGLISRSGLQAVAYVTKRGESSFHVMHPIPPYFQERADWKFVQSLLEASTETKLKFEQSWIMRASEGARTLQDVQRNIRRFLEGVKAPPLPPAKPKRGKQPAEPKEHWLQKPARGLSGDVYYVLNKYLDDIMPQLGQMPYTTALELAPGLNVMDLRDYEFPLQALVIRSVTDRIREHLDGTINIIPEAWKFAPKFRGSPVRLAAEEYVREAAAMKNFLWIDSQDLAGVADVLMRQVGVWLFGVQRATREIWRALEHMPEGLPAKRPRPADIATLSKGQFYVCFGREMHKVYVQPAWMTAAHAEAIARGEEEVESARDILKEYAHEHVQRAASAANGRNPAHMSESGAGNDSKSGDEISDRPGATRRDKSRATGSDRHNASDDTETVVQTSSPREMRQHHEQARTDPDNGRDRQPAKPEAARTSAAARDARPVAPHDDPEEEAIWKEKYEALRQDFEDFRNAVAQDAAAANGNRDPGILQVTATRPMITATIDKPEVQVKVKRRVIEMDGSSVQGTIAILLSEGFFDQPKNGTSVIKELRRRGLSFKDATAGVRCGEIAGMGFLTREGRGEYQAVPGMKVHIVEE